MTPAQFDDWRQLGVYGGVAVFRGVTADSEGWFMVCPVCEIEQGTTVLDAVWRATAHNDSAAHKLAGVLF